MKIFIDPGHGGADLGASNQEIGVSEANVNLQVGIYLNDLLISRGFETKMSRTTDVAVSLDTRANEANEWGADYFISIHCNSSENPEASGTETFCRRPNTTAEGLAKSVQAELVKELKLRDRGVNYANFAVLRLTDMPAILVELAFISNNKEATLLKNPDFQKRCALAIANGLNYFIDAKPS